MIGYRLGCADSAEGADDLRPTVAGMTCSNCSISSTLDRGTGPGGGQEVQSRPEAVRLMNNEPGVGPVTALAFVLTIGRVNRVAAIRVPLSISANYKRPDSGYRSPAIRLCSRPVAATKYVAPSHAGYSSSGG
jgi:hypothetical protein